MPRATANGIEIEYEEIGSPLATPLLLIMGLGAQLTYWPLEFCEQLAERGFRVIRFDNRDIGLSTHFDESGVPDFSVLAAGGTLTDPPAYTLDEMADDAAGLLDALGLDAAHIVGASMGGMIAQLVATRHPSRTLSLTSIMSNTGMQEGPSPDAAAVAALTAPPPEDREAAIAQAVAGSLALAGPAFVPDEDELRAMVAAAYDRAHHPAGERRQLAAIMAAPDRAPALASVAVPAFVVHGEADPLVPVQGGRDTAAAIPGAELLIIEGMGHQLPREAWPRIIDGIANVAARVPA